MNKIFSFIVFFLLITVRCSFAEDWICYDQTTKEITEAINGDCLRLGLCTGFNNTGLKEGCFEATHNEYLNAKEDPYTKYSDKSEDVAKKSRVIPMTDQEKQAKKDKENPVNQDKESAINKLKGIGLSDEEINFLINN